MHRAGKAHWLTILGILSIFVIAFLAFFSRDSAASTAADFMVALSKGDAKRLTELSYFPGVSPEEVQKKWDFTVDAGKYYRFTWRITNVSQSDETSGAATMQVTRNAASGSSYEEKHQLPLVKTDDGWKVDVPSINRLLYPALPR